MIFGVALMMCCPFQYFNRFSDCSELTMSISLNDVSALMSFTERFPFARCNTSRMRLLQNERYDTCPRSDSGRSGVPSFSSRLESSYYIAIRKLPYPLRWYGGSVRMHARL